MRTRTVFEHLSRAAIEAGSAVPAGNRRESLPERFPAMVTPGQLRSLIAIGAVGSEALAAAELGVTQPAVHQDLHKLERALELRLFYRLRSGTRLTPAGEALLRGVKLAVAEIQAMQADLGLWKGEIRGRLVIGVLPLSVSIFLPRAIEALVKAHPHLSIEIVDGTYERLVQQLLSADIDAIAGALRPPGERHDLQQVHLLDDELVVVARKGHPALDRPGVRIPDLLQWSWVTPLTDTPAARVFENVFASAGVPPPISHVQANSPTSTLSLVMQTGHLCMASKGESLVDDRGGQLRVVPVELPSTVRRIGLIMRNAGEPSADLSLLIEACLTCTGTRPGAESRPVARQSPAARA